MVGRSRSLPTSPFLTNRSPGHDIARRIGAALLWHLLLLSASAAPLEIIGDIRRLPREQAASALPVKLHGTCIYTANGEFFLHDGSHGIWVSSLTARTRGLLADDSGLANLKAGDILQVEGVTDPGNYASQILPSVIRRTGSGEMPEPVRISAEQLVAGSEDGQYVELDGVIQAIQVLPDRTVCTLVAKGVNCLLALYGEAARDLPPLVDARVRVVGAFAPDFNNRSEAVRPKVISSRAGCIEILTHPPADPFDSPSVPLSRLRGFSPDVTLFHRKVTSGLVTFVRPGEFFFLRDGDTSIRVLSNETHLQPGWKVDVAGFIAVSQHLAALKNGIVRKTGEAEIPPPQAATARALLDSASWRGDKSQLASSDLNGHTLTLHGRITRVDRGPRMEPTTVWIESDDIAFPAFLPSRQFSSATQQVPPAWQIGAEVSLTGACELIFSGRPDPLGLYNPDGFHVWLAAPGDLMVTRPAPWWTPRRLTIALSATGIATLIAVGGIAVLRRKIKRQILIISRGLEKSAVAAERERMARDLHDTLEQQLTGVAMQLESIAKSPDARSPEFANRIGLASRMLQHSREEARRSVWDLRNKILENHGFAAALESLATSAAIDGGPQVSTIITGSRAHLPSAVTYPLLRMTQEALANALKHAQAQKIIIELEMAPHYYRIGITDDGRGFDPKSSDPQAPPHFGLIGIRERASKIGASVEISSRPGYGCKVTIQLPLTTS